MQERMSDLHSLRKHQSEIPPLWLHPLHTRDGLPSPRRLVGSVAQPADIKGLMEVARSAVQKFSAAWGFRDRQWHNQHSVALGGPVLNIKASDGSEEDLWQISLRFSEVAPFQAQVGTQFLVIGLRDGADQSKVGSWDVPFNEFWIIRVGGDEASEQPEFPNVALLKSLTALGASGAVRSDLYDAYKVTEEPIGIGGCSSVYLGRPCQKKDEVVAVKILTPENGNMAVAEAVFLMGSTQHPNIIGFHGIFKFQDPATDGSLRWAVLMEYCSAGDLNDFLTSNGPCSELRAAEIMFGLLSALSHLHSQGIVHRDVKSENILLSDGRPVLADFGIAAHLDDAVEMKRRCGSPGHCAPEILASRPYGAKIDVFGSGVVLYFMLSGILPFWGPDIASVLRRTNRCNVKMDSEYFGQVSNRAKSIIKQFLKKDPENRPDSSAALRQVTMAYSKHLVESSLLSCDSADKKAPFHSSICRDSADSQVSCSDDGRSTMSTVMSDARTTGRDEDWYRGRASFTSGRDSFTSSATCGFESEDQRLSFSAEAHSEKILSEAYPPVKFPRAFGDKGMSSLQQRRFPSMPGKHSERSGPDEGAGPPSTSDQSAAQPWAFQGMSPEEQGKIPKRVFAKLWRRRLGKLSSDGSGSLMSPRSAVESIHEDATAETSPASATIMPQAPPSGAVRGYSRRCVSFLKRGLQHEKYKQGVPSAVDMQTSVQSCFGAEVHESGEETTAGSEKSGSDFPDVRYSDTSAYSEMSGKFSKSGFTDDDGDSKFSSHRSPFDDVFEDGIPIEDKMLSEFPEAPKSTAKLRFFQPSTPRGSRGWWQRAGTGNAGFSLHQRASFTSGLTGDDDLAKIST